MIKRNFNSESYDHAFSEQAIKTPVFHQEIIKKMTNEHVQIFCSKHGLLILSFINLIGMIALLIFMMGQLDDLDRQMDEGRSKFSKLESLVKVLGNQPVKTNHQGSSQQESQPEPELISSDLNIRYLGMIQADHSFKALVEIDDVTSFLSKGQMIDGRWLIKSFDQSQMMLESIKGQQVTILLE